jgi:hypothetical protein
MALADLSRAVASDRVPLSPLSPSPMSLSAG